MQTYSVQSRPELTNSLPFSWLIRAECRNHFCTWDLLFPNCTPHLNRTGKVVRCRAWSKQPWEFLFLQMKNWNHTFNYFKSCIIMYVNIDISICTQKWCYLGLQTSTYPTTSSTFLHYYFHLPPSALINHSLPRACMHACAHNMVLSPCQPS